MLDSIGHTVKNVQYSQNGWIKGRAINKTEIFPSHFFEVIRTPNRAPVISYECHSNSVQGIQIGEKDIPEILLCPVWLDSPEMDICQCENGHGLWGTCIIPISIKNCPQRRISLKMHTG